jgi:formyl-CoA transferase
MGGLMSITGLPGQGPVRAGIPVADLTAGVFCAMGILIALLERETSDQGQWVQTSLLESQISMLDFQAERWLLKGEVPRQAGNDHPTSIPTGVFPTADGHINIAATGQAMWARLCKALGAEHLLDDVEFQTDAVRSKNRVRLNKELAAITATRISVEWMRALNDAGVPCGPIYSIDQVFADEQVRHLGLAQTVSHPALGAIQLVGQPVHLSRTPSKLRTAAPEKGEHTDEILREFGYDDGAIADFRRRNIV